MSSLIALISPAKLMDDQTHYPEFPESEPALGLDKAEALVKKLRKLGGSELGNLLDISPALADENVRRYKEWHRPFDHSNSMPAIYLFRGEVYRGLEADTLGKKDLDHAQKHLRILSGLYGILRPLDLIQPYRLMMGTPFSYDARNKNLYAYWSKDVTGYLETELDKKGTLVNLASGEYFKVVNTAALGRKVVTCDFKEFKAGKWTVVSTYAKLARGKMASYILRERITKPSDLKGFDIDGYTFMQELSGETEWVFGRKTQR
jgi:uncharacterized protein